MRFTSTVDKICILCIPSLLDLGLPALIFYCVLFSFLSYSKYYFDFVNFKCFMLFYRYLYTCIVSALWKLKSRNIFSPKKLYFVIRINEFDPFILITKIKLQTNHYSFNTTQRMYIDFLK